MLRPFVIVMGVSGAGKTTLGQQLAEALGVPFIDADDHHSDANKQKMQSGTPLSDQDRWPWLDTLAATARQHIEQGTGGVMACSLLKQAYRQRLGLPRSGISLVYLYGPPQVIAERLQARQHAFMPTALLDSQLASLEPPDPEAALHVDVRLSGDEQAKLVLASLGLPSTSH